jgi:hypothetical protein
VAVFPFFAHRPKQVKLMEFNGPSLAVWVLMREGIPSTLSLEKLFTSAARHAARQQTAAPNAGEIARLAKWPASTCHTALRAAQVTSIWSFACLVSLECAVDAGGDADKLAKRLRRALQRSAQGSVTSEDELLICVISAAVALGCAAAPGSVSVNTVVVEQPSSQVVLGVTGHSQYESAELPQAAEIIVV